MLFTFVTVSAALIYFALMFTGGKSWREVREMFYGNYFAEDAVINDTDKPNSRQAVENCIENNIGIKTEVRLTADKRTVVCATDDLSAEYGTDKKLSQSNLEELEETGIITLTEFLNLVDGRVPVILEMKASKDNEAMCRNTSDAIKATEKKNIAVCSLNPAVVGWFRDYNKDVFRGIVSAPAKEFKGTSKLQSWIAGNLGNNGVCRPNFTLYRKGPQSIFVKLAVASGVFNGVWTVEDKNEATALEATRDMIVIRGFVPEKIHYKDMPVVEKTPQQLEAEKKAAERQAKFEEKQRAAKQRSISEILADDEDEGIIDEIREEVSEMASEVKEEVTELIEEIKEEIISE